MNSIKKILVVLTCFFLLIGCSEGPAEKAGKKVDTAYEKTKDTLQNKGDAEKAGEKLDEITQ